MIGLAEPLFQDAKLQAEVDAGRWYKIIFLTQCRMPECKGLVYFAQRCIGKVQAVVNRAHDVRLFVTRDERIHSAGGRSHEVIKVERGPLK